MIYELHCISIITDNNISLFQGVEEKLKELLKAERERSDSDGHPGSHDHQPGVFLL